jgi:hypothetical protein
MGLTMYDEYGNTLQVSVQVRRRREGKRERAMLRVDEKNAHLPTTTHHQAGINLRNFDVVSVRVVDYYYSGNNWGR